MHPYSGATFFSFFATFFSRLGEMIHGRFVSDEVQVITLAGIAISGALVGTFLVLRRMTMLANSLSHTILLGIVLAFLIVRPVDNQLDLTVILIASLLTGLLTTLLTQLFTKVLKLQEDASIGLVFTTLFALGVILVTLYTRSSHFGLEAIMGNVDALARVDLRNSALVALANIALIALLFRPLVVTTFDATLAKGLGISSLLITYVLMLQTSATAIISFRAVGVFLFLSFLVGPPLIARMYTHKLSRILIIAPAVGVGASWMAVALSRHILTVYRIPISTSGLAATLIALLTFGSGIRKIYRKKKAAA